ncbi:MAG: chitobiase/beta-hexosaminidase C-terminal domain-containing protein [Bacteroidaceae bacterium]|nr:chitobiase/beta-hexosaminidase C-terminal domain-containing protein [Bacteroidaceae bacterium]
MKRILLTTVCCLLVATCMYAQDVVLDFTTNGWGIPSGSKNKTTESVSYTNSGYTITLACGGGGSDDGYYYTSSYLIMGKTGATLTLPAFNFAVSKIEVVGQSSGAAGVTTNIFVGETPVSVECTGAKGTNVFEISSDYQAAGNIYTLKVTNSNNTRITKINIYSVQEVSVAAPSFSVQQGNFSEHFNLELASSGNRIYFTLDGTTPTADSDEYSAALPIKASVTVKALAIDKNGNKSDVVEAVYTKTGETKAATLVTDAAALSAGDNIVIVASAYDYALSTNQKENNRGAEPVTKDGQTVNVNDNVQFITLESGDKQGTFAFNTGEGYLYAASSSYNYLKTKEILDDNASWTIAISDNVATIVAQGENVIKNLKYNSTSKLFSCYADDKQKDVSIYKYVPSEYALTVTAAGWSTLFLDYSAKIPPGVNVYYVNSVQADCVKLVPVKNVIPAYAAVLVEAPQGTYIFNVAQGGSVLADNSLQGSVYNKYIVGNAYVLGVSDGTVGLYPAELMGGVFLNNANKAYLSASLVPDAEVLSSQGFSFRLDDGETTAVEDVVTVNDEPVIYTLSGVRIDKIDAPGIYIVNGEKYLVK